MEINKQLFEDVLSGKLNGTFVFRNQLTCNSDELTRTTMGTYKAIYPYSIKNRTYTPNGIYNSSYEDDVDIVDFIIDKNMETKELKIEIPEGFEIDKENSSFEKIVFKKKEDTKPRSWEEYCHNFKGELFFENNNEIDSVIINNGMSYIAKSYLPSKELVEAFSAMMQLVSVRQDWLHKWSIDNGMVDDWNGVNGQDGVQWAICYKPFIDSIELERSCVINFPLSFPTKEMAEDFRKSFIDLLEVAKPLI